MLNESAVSRKSFLRYSDFFNRLLQDDTARAVGSCTVARRLALRLQRGWMASSWRRHVQLLMLWPVWQLQCSQLGFQVCKNLQVPEILYFHTHTHTHTPSNIYWLNAL